MDIASKLAIHELLARCAYALDARDLSTLATCFAPDAMMNINILGGDTVGGAGPVRFEGRDRIMALMRDSLMAQQDQRRHVTTNTMVVAEADGEVTLLSNLTLTAVADGAIRLVTSGLYRDRVRREGEHWVIVERRIELDMPY